MATNPLAAQNVAVLGAGTMGRGIAQLALQAGAYVTVIDPAENIHDEARRALADTFTMLAGKGRLSEAPEALLARLGFSTELAAAATSSWVFEAAPERLDLKRELFAKLEQVAPAARLATNTSTLPVTAIASACQQPERVVGVHFFNPAPLMRLVEVIPGVRTAPALVEEALAVARALGREPVLAQDSPGFIVNRVARPFYGEALRLLGEGVDQAVIDASLRSAGFRMGPFELLDLIGLDVNLAATLSVYEAFYQLPRYRPHPLQQALVSAGRLGRKSGHGFYRYPRPQPEDTQQDSGPAAAGDLPLVHVMGSGAAADHLRRNLPATALSPDPSQAALILDARLTLEEKLVLPANATAPRLVLCWAHSASAFAGASRAASRGADGTASENTASSSNPAATIGFSLLPPPARFTATSPPQWSAVPLTLELLAPVTGASAELAQARGLLARLGVTVLAMPDQPGGAAFRIFALLLNEAVSAVAEQLASNADIDLAMRLGVNYPEGPLAWGAELGLSDLCTALASLHDEVGGERFAPHGLLRRLVTAGGASFAQLRQEG